MPVSIEELKKEIEKMKEDMEYMTNRTAYLSLHRKRTCGRW